MLYINALAANIATKEIMYTITEKIQFPIYRDKHML